MMIQKYIFFSEGDPQNYLTYFKRGTVYYALGKARFALQDFTKVLELKSDFTSARMQRATVYLKLAQYVDAKEDYLQVVREKTSLKKNYKQNAFFCGHIIL